MEDQHVQPGAAPSPGGPSLAGRAAVVTGGANGIGRAITLDLAGRGVAVSVVDIDAEGADRVVAEVEAAGGRGLAVVADVAEEDQIQAAVDTAADQFGRLDVLVNNAATFDPEMMATDLDIENTPLATWRRTMAINLDGPFFACRAAIPRMLDDPGRGVIVNVSSTAAHNGDVVHVAYCASKAALESLTRSIATSHGLQGIRCNTVATGLVLTDLAEVNVPPAKLEAYRRSWLVDGPGRPEEIAALVAFVASDDARYLQGQTILVDGGVNAHQPWHANNDIIHPDAPAVVASAAASERAAAERASAGQASAGRASAGQPAGGAL